MIDDHWGGTEAFLRQGLRLTEDRQERLQDLLLEDGRSPTEASHPSRDPS